MRMQRSTATAAGLPLDDETSSDELALALAATLAFIYGLPSAALGCP